VTGHPLTDIFILKNKLFPSDETELCLLVWMFFSLLDASIHMLGFKEVNTLE